MSFFILGNRGGYIHEISAGYFMVSSDIHEKVDIRVFLVNSFNFPLIFCYLLSEVEDLEGSANCILLQTFGIRSSGKKKREVKCGFVFPAREGNRCVLGVQKYPGRCSSYTPSPSPPFPFFSSRKLFFFFLRLRL